MSKYKLVLFDIDGVLTEIGKNIQPSGVEAINLLHQHGLKVGYASGKHIWYITGGLVFAGLLKDDTVIVGENGGVIFNPKKKKLHFCEQYIDDILKLRAFFFSKCDRINGNHYFAKKGIWEEPKNTAITIFPKNLSELSVGQLAKYFTSVIQQHKLNLYISENSDSVDIMQKGIDKATGIEILCKWLGFKPEEIIAFGDYYNDIPMLNAVGYPITVANSPEDIKQLIRGRNGYISSKEHGEGVKEAVEHLINEGII